MKNINIFYWSLPILFAIFWFLITLIFTPIYESYFLDAQGLGLSPRVGMILLSPFALFVAVILLYVLLYIERKLICNWQVVVGINALLLIICLVDVAKAIIYTNTDTSESAGWGYYHALEIGLKYIPFILISFFTLHLIKKRLLFDAEEDRKDINYVLFYLLPILYVIYSSILGYALSKVIGWGEVTTGETSLSLKTADLLGYATAASLTMPVCAVFLYLYKKYGKNRIVFNIITVVSTIVMIAFWYYISRDIFAENVTQGITFLCFMVLPWTFASHFISLKYINTKPS